MSSYKIFGQPLHRVVVVGSALAGSLAFLIYLLRKTKNENLRDVSDAALEFETPTAKANRLKEEGNKQFGARHYVKASELFAQAIKILKTLEDGESKSKALAVLYNNYSACNEFQENLDRALEYSSMAIELNPDYLKPYVRRARIYMQNKRLKECLFDYGTVIRLLNKSNEVFRIDGQVETYLKSMILVAKDVVSENVEKLFKSRANQETFLPISQSNITEWMGNAIHDPLLNRMKELKKTKPDDLLDLALFNFKNSDFNNVLPFSLEVSVSRDVDERKRFLGRLLSARIYQFAGLKRQFNFIFQIINELWDNSSEEFKMQNTDLLIALMILKIEIDSPAAVESQLLQNFELSKGNGDAFVALSIVHHKFHDFDKAFSMLEKARIVEPRRPHIEFYDIATRFAAASRNQDLATVHQVAVEIDNRIRNGYNPPEHAVILAARIFTVSNNTPYALDVIRKHDSFKNEKNIAIQLLYTVIKHDLDSGITNSIDDFERKLEKLLVKDPHNFETLRMLYRCSFDKGDFKQATERAKAAWHNTRTIEEFSSAYHDLILACALEGTEFPVDNYPMCQGPDYIRADSNENVLRFSDSSLNSYT